MFCGELHTRRTPRRLPGFAVVLVDYAGSILSRCQKGRYGRTPFQRLQGKKPIQQFVPFGEEVLARPLCSEPLNRMGSTYKLGVWLGVRSNSAECFVETAEKVYSERARSGGDKEAINSVIGVSWRSADGKWTVDRPATQIDLLPPPPVP